MRSQKILDRPRQFTPFQVEGAWHTTCGEYDFLWNLRVIIWWCEMYWVH